VGAGGEAVTDNITLPRAVAFEMLEASICGEHIGNFYAALYAALAAPEPEPTVKESLTVDAKREPATREQIAEAYIKPDIDGRWRDFELGFRAAEKFYGITKEDT
jgi:hypothetical protein